MRYTSIIGSDDDISAVDNLDSIEDTLMNGCWANFRVFLLGTDIERT